MIAGMLDNFHFLRPLWLLLLLAVPLIAWAWRRHAARGNPWRRVVDPHLLPALLETDPATARSRSPLWLLIAVTLLAAFALAGPAWQLLPQPLMRSEAGLIIAIDLSDRMRAADLPPSRLARARFKVADLLRNRTDGQVGLIAYAGDAFTVAPLTRDSATLESLLSALEPDVMPVAGQRTDRAITLAVRLARDAGLVEADLLLLTDSVDTAAVNAARRAAADGLRISVLGVGTAQGAPVPLAGGGFVSGAGGRTALATLQVDELTALAAAGGGRYATITADLTDLRQLGVLVAREALQEADDADVIARYRDHGPWLLLLLLPLAALGFRRGWLGCLPLLLLLQPAPVSAFDWSALWLRPEQRAHRALEAGELEQARALAREPARRGSAAYREGDFEAAIDSFAELDSADGHYNRGNALARAGQLQEAIDAYDEALSRSPDMADALANRAAVEQLLQQQPPPEQGEGDPEQGESGDDAPADGKPQEGEGESGEPSEGDSEGEPEPSDSEDSDEGGDQDERGEEQSPEGDDSEAQNGDGSDQDPAQDAEQEPAGAPDEAQQEALSRALDEAMQEPPADAPEPVAIPEDREGDATQAIEQTLRRIPDDPGGLLRRKFALEHRRRQAEGRGDE